MKLSSVAPMAALAALAIAAPATAEVVRATDDSFVSRHEVVVAATPKEVWLALISPSGWWRSDHTWSGDAKNLTLTPQAGGCFCETIPEVDEPGRFTLEGSVEHMRVVQAYPEQALRMVGALGPLQSEPVNGVLTITITTVPKGTRIVWEYNVGGPMRYELPVISKAVDGVMGLQIAALAKPLKIVAMPPPPPPPAPEPAPGSGPADAGSPPPATKPAAGLASPSPVPAASPGGAKPVARPAAGPTTPPAGAAAPKPASPATPATSAPKPAPKVPSVADVFGDLGEGPKR